MLACFENKEYLDNMMQDWLISGDGQTSFIQSLYLVQISGKQFFPL